MQTSTINGDGFLSRLHAFLKCDDSKKPTTTLSLKTQSVVREETGTVSLPYQKGNRFIMALKRKDVSEKTNYFRIYHPVMVSLRTFSLVCLVIRLTTIIAMIAMTNA